MKFNIRISNSFLNGESNTPFAVDGPFLTDDEIKIIQRFLEDVANGRALVGKNKPSWVDDNHDKIPGSDNYEQENYWHYHCGPTWYPNTFKNYTINLNFNPGGMHSNECIHYAKMIMKLSLLDFQENTYLSFHQMETTIRFFMMKKNTRRGLFCVCGFPSGRRWHSLKTRPRKRPVTCHAHVMTSLCTLLHQIISK